VRYRLTVRLAQLPSGVTVRSVCLFTASFVVSASPPCRITREVAAPVEPAG
jgi:hypothetical protein